MDRVIKQVDGVTFELKENFDFAWLSEYGKVFSVFDRQDSGNICFGVESGKGRRFLKFAGAPTVNYNGRVEDAVERLKSSVRVYEDLCHPALVNLLDASEVGNGYLILFEWSEGECLHAHWNFDKYPKHTHPESPNVRFSLLGLDKKLQCLDSLFRFHVHAEEKGYVAVDFYDGSIIYDFKTSTAKICDIDYYHRGLFVNSVGRMWGSSRFMSPEEFEKGAPIDEVTNVYTMGALAFELLGENRERSIKEWSASRELFEVAQKATRSERDRRYGSIDEFYRAWKKAL